MRNMISKTWLRQLFPGLILLLLPAQYSIAAATVHHKTKPAAHTASKPKPSTKAVATIPKISPTEQINKDITAGDSAVSTNNYEQALSRYKSAATLAESSKLPALDMTATAKVGNAYLLLKDYPSAISFLTKAQAIQVSPGSVDPSLNPKIDTTLSTAYLANGDYQKADDTAASGLILFDALLTPSSTVKPTDATATQTLAKSAAKLAFTAGSAQMALQNYALALGRFQQAQVYVAKAGQTGTLMDADTLTAIASANKAQNKWQDAISFDDQALTLYTKLNNVSGQRAALADKAAAYQASGDFPNALTSYYSLLTMIEAAGDTNAESQVASIIGLDCIHLKNYDKAKLAYTYAANASSKLGDKLGVARADIGIGVAQEGLDDFSSAADAYNAALPEFIASNDNEDAGAVLLNLGGAYVQLSQNQDAMKAYTQASTLFTKAGDTKSAAVATQKAQQAISAMIPGQ